MVPRMLRIWPVLLSILVGLFVLDCRPNSVDRPRGAPAQLGKSNVPDSVFLIMEFAVDRAETLSMPLSKADTLTVLDVLKSMTARNGVTLRTKDYPGGL